MSSNPVIILRSGKDFVTVEPGSVADKIFRERGYVDPNDPVKRGRPPKTKKAKAEKGLRIEVKAEDKTVIGYGD